MFELVDVIDLVAMVQTTFDAGGFFERREAIRTTLANGGGIASPHRDLSQWLILTVVAVGVMMYWKSEKSERVNAAEARRLDREERRMAAQLEQGRRDLAAAREDAANARHIAAILRSGDYVPTSEVPATQHVDAVFGATPVQPAAPKEPVEATAPAAKPAVQETPVERPEGFSDEGLEDVFRGE